MQFLAISRMRTDLFGDADFAPLLEDEAQRVRTLYNRRRGAPDLASRRRARRVLGAGGGLRRSGARDHWFPTPRQSRHAGTREPDPAAALSRLRTARLIPFRTERASATRR